MIAEVEGVALQLNRVYFQSTRGIVEMKQVGVHVPVCGFGVMNLPSMLALNTRQDLQGLL
jgi:hypothetical protein